MDEIGAAVEKVPLEFPTALPRKKAPLELPHGAAAGPYAKHHNRP